MTLGNIVSFTSNTMEGNVAIRQNSNIPSILTILVPTSMSLFKIRQVMNPTKIGLVSVTVNEHKMFYIPWPVLHDVKPAENTHCLILSYGKPEHEIKQEDYDTSMLMTVTEQYIFSSRNLLPTARGLTENLDFYATTSTDDNMSWSRASQISIYIFVVSGYKETEVFPIIYFLKNTSYGYMGGLPCSGYTEPCRLITQPRLFTYNVEQGNKLFSKPMFTLANRCCCITPYTQERTCISDGENNNLFPFLPVYDNDLYFQNGILSNQNSSSGQIDNALLFQQILYYPPSTKDAVFLSTN
jgi:hypothetical protein